MASSSINPPSDNGRRNPAVHSARASEALLQHDRLTFTLNRKTDRNKHNYRWNAAVYTPKDHDSGVESDDSDSKPGNHPPAVDLDIETPGRRSTSNCDSFLPTAPKLLAADSLHLDDSATFRQDIEKALSSSPPGAPLLFHVSPIDLSRLRSLLDEISGISRFSYEHGTELARLDMPEKPIHNQTIAGVIRLFEGARHRMSDVAQELDEPTIANRLDAVYEKGTTDIHVPGVMLVQADFCFREERMQYLPTVVGEVAYSQDTQSVMQKSIDYTDVVSSGSSIPLVFVVDIEYPHAHRATVSMRVRDGDGHPHGNARWVVHQVQFFVAGAEPQPEGNIDLYVSDFLRSSPGLPEAMIRPLPARDANTNEILAPAR
ncbi:hypothetical protein Brms1b_013747 [Colletotrichum noveboracense]|nr:hypothetical protein COL940_014368 [Colletotrichum noveboracense]KAJ0269027.1 hypothetical protein CBS470a_013787 [Colletotrichum nupharicola]KAJ0295965.1 hypothetical protein Brms1b_013747 [Colletotrichum noveboracense]